MNASFSTSGMIRTAHNDNNDALARLAGKAGLDNLFTHRKSLDRRR